MLRFEDTTLLRLPACLPVVTLCATLQLPTFFVVPLLDRMDSAETLTATMGIA